MKQIKTIIGILSILLINSSLFADTQDGFTKHFYNENIEKKLYFFSFNLPADFEVYLNDIKINHSKSSSSGVGYLNEYILGSGKQTMKLIARDVEDTLPFWIEIYSTNEHKKNRQTVKELMFPRIESPTPYYEESWEFDAVVPFVVSGWSSGEDLSKEKKSELEKKVIAKFEYYRELLNTGNVEKFMDENSKGYNEFIKTYYEQNWPKFDQDKDSFVSQKGFMLPIEDYKMKIYGNGKLVTLERIDEPFVGYSALLALVEKDGEAYTNYLSLFMPEGSDELKPIRLRVDTPSVSEAR